MKIYWYEHTGAHNIGHFLDDMCIPFYGAMKKRNLVGKDYQVIMKRNSDSSGKFILPDVWDFLCKNKVKFVDAHPKIKNDYRKIYIEGEGPVNLGGGHYRGFSNDLLNHFDIKRKKPQRIIVLKRSTRRRIVNEDELIKGLKTLGREVYAVEFGKMSFQQQLQELQDCSALIGYHGAALMNTLFTPTNSSTLEVLPYGWPYGRYKKVGRARGQNYLQWRNPDPKKSITNRPTKFDTSVTPLKNPKILHKKQCPPNSPIRKTDAWKKAAQLKTYFQSADTIVDVNAIVKIVKNKMLK